MNRKTVYSMLALSMVLTFMVPVPSTTGWVYPDSTSDAKFEMFGPRADRLLVRLYPDMTSMLEGLRFGEIDMTDSSLSRAEYEDLINYPEIKVVSYGAEFSFLMLDMNNNGNEFLGNPPDPAYPNPIYPNPLNVTSLRQAIGHLIDRVALIGPDVGFYLPIYTPMPPPLAKYVLDVYGDPAIPWAWEYNPTKAEQLLTEDGFIDTDGDGIRNWNLTGENLYLDFVIRTDDSMRTRIGDALTVEMLNVGIGVNVHYATLAEAYIRVMINKDYHLYTGLYMYDRPDPDILYDLFHSSQYGHPLGGGNHNAIMDPVLDQWLEQLRWANSQDEAVVAAFGAQYYFALMAFKHPIMAPMGNQAYSRYYVGPELPYSGRDWLGIVNMPGYGLDNKWTFMNMHPMGYAYDHGDPTNPMTIRWGFSIPSIQMLNPIYASQPHDWKILNQIYGSLLRRNASNLAEFLPWYAKSFEVGVYEHPIYGTCSKVRFTLRPDISWSDGYALTVADVYFTFLELKQMLDERGYPPPWWWSNIENILDFKIFDPYNFEVLLDVKSYWALTWIGQNIILPKHIWQPIVQTGDPQGFAPDPNLIGSGPWRLQEYVENSHVLMVANRPGRTVQTNLPGSEPITALNGFANTYPLHINVHPLIKFQNLTVISGENWINSNWTEIKGPDVTPLPVILPWTLTDWIDGNLNGVLDQGDIIAMEQLFGDGRLEYFDVFQVERVGDVVYILVDWWTHKIPADGLPPLYYTPTEIGVTLYNWMWADENGTQPGPDLVVNKYVYILFPNGTRKLLPTIIPAQLVIPEFPGHHKEKFNLVLPKCRYIIEVDVHIKEPNWDSWKLYSTWINYTFTFWVTRIEDIIGGALDYYDGEPIHGISKEQLEVPDCKVDIRDVAKAARAFGSYPGHPYWNPVADITGPGSIPDYRIDIRDIAQIARQFGFA